LLCYALFPAKTNIHSLLFRVFLFVEVAKLHQFILCFPYFLFFSFFKLASKNEFLEASTTFLEKASA
jgi:hypothetical protein